jgi:hypothetical protein
MSEEIKGTWSIGKAGGSVVSDTPHKQYIDTGHDDVLYYGGFLVAESIPTIAYRNLISAAPDMYEALKNIENDSNYIPETIWNMIQNAIRKAEGKE